MNFSIIIPVYNAKTYLGACLDSVLQQTYSDFEVLLVDDGSTDGESGVLCDRYAESYPNRIRVLHKQNGGAGDARNAALPLARGEYITFLDSDDALVPNALEILSNQIAQTHAEIYYFGRQIFYPAGQEICIPQEAPFDTPLPLEQIPQMLFSPPAAWSAIWKRSLFENSDIRFRAKGWGEDFAMTRKMLTTAQSIVYLDEVLYHYFIRSGSVTTRENLDCNVEILAAMQDVLEWFQAHGLFERYADELCKLCIDNVLYDASTRILKVVPQHPLLDAFLNFTTQFFPSYRANPYLRTYSKKKKLILSLIGKRQYRAVHLLFCMAQR